ncbi:MAG: tyrosine-type recombinase/integrase [Armatimonadota bacterium]
METSITDRNEAVCLLSSDEKKMINLWLQQNDSPQTRRSYLRTASEFVAFVDKPLVGVTRIDIQEYKNHLIASDLKPASINQRLAAVKSLLSDLHRSGYLKINVGAAVKLLKVPDRLAERILEQHEIVKMIALEDNPRNHAILEILYYTGARVSELVSLTWKDLQPRDQGGQVTLYGKGGKTRWVRLNDRIWNSVQALREDAGIDDPVFISRKHGPLDTSQVWRIVRASAKRAGIQGNVSPHWLRHGHASHALDAGCPVHVVKDTLGHSSLATTSRYAHARPTESSSDYLP